MKVNAAVFVDGDNISSSLFETVYDRLQAGHSISLTRVYGDYSHSSMAKWHELCRNKGFEQIQCANSPKKNSTDLKLIDDIYFNLYENQRVKTYIIISNDRDYTFVVQRLKSKGKKVIIVGHNYMPIVYKNLADEFICIKSDKQLKKEENNKDENDNSDSDSGKKRKRSKKKKNRIDNNYLDKSEDTSSEDLSNTTTSSPENNKEEYSNSKIDKTLLYNDAENVVLETLKIIGKKESVISHYKKIIKIEIEKYSNPDVRLFFLPFGRLSDILEKYFSHLLEIRRVKENTFFKVFLKAKENDLNL